MKKLSKKNEEKTPSVTKKGILAFFTTSSSLKVPTNSDQSNSPDSVQKIEDLSTETEVSSHFQDNMTLSRNDDGNQSEHRLLTDPVPTFPNSKEELSLAEKAPKRIICENNKNLETEKEREIESDQLETGEGEDAVPQQSAQPAKIFPLFQKKPREPSPAISSEGTTGADPSVIDMISAPSVIEIDLVNSAAETPKEKEPKETIVVSSLNSSSPFRIEIKPENIIEPLAEFIPEEIEGQMASEEPDRRENIQPTSFDEAPAEGEYRRSARIRSNRDVIAKRFEEQKKFLESSDDDSCKFIKLGSSSSKKESSRKEKSRKNEEMEDTDKVLPASKRKKVASIFISKEEKARLAAEEKERKAREAALLEQERLLKLAEERERRIQEEIRNTKQRNDDMLGATKQEDSIANPFFAARNNIKVISLVADGYVSIDSDLTEFQCLEEISTYSQVKEILINLPQPSQDALILKNRRSFVIIDSSIDHADQPLSSSEGFLSPSVWEPILFRSLWTDYITSSYQPPVITVIDHEAAPVSFNPCDQFRVKQKAKIIGWLESWRNRRLSSTLNNARKRRGRLSHSKKLKSSAINDDEDEEFSIADTISEFSGDEEGEDDDGDDDADICVKRDQRSVYTILGKTGTGKTSLVYECAKAVGAAIIEINSTQVRSSAAIKRLISEAAQSHNLYTATTAVNEPSAMAIDLEGEERTGALSIILFDEVDVFFDEEDIGFHSAIIKLANDSKSPIILTAERLPQSLSSLSSKICVLRPPATNEMSLTLGATSNLSDSSGVEALVPLAMACAPDYRAALNSLSLFDDLSILKYGPAKSSWNSWLVQKGVDFALFDSISVRKEVHRVESELPFTWSDVILVPPTVNCVFPHLVGAKNGDTEITIQGENFLQSLSGKFDDNEGRAGIQVFLGANEVTLIEHHDNELKFLLPTPLPAGYHPITVQLTFNSDSKSVRLKHQDYPFPESWIVVSDVYPVDFAKYLFTLCSSYASYVKANEVANMFNPRTTVRSNKKRKKSKILRRSTASNYTGSEEALQSAEMEVDENADEDQDLFTEDLIIPESSDGARLEEEDHAFSDSEDDAVEESAKKRKIIKFDDEDEKPDPVVADEGKVDSAEGKVVNEGSEEPRRENEINDSLTDSLVLPEQPTESLEEQLLQCNQLRKEYFYSCADLNTTLYHWPIILKTNRTTNNSFSEDLNSLQTYCECIDHFSSFDQLSKFTLNCANLPEEDDFIHNNTFIIEETEQIIATYRHVLTSCYQEKGILALNHDQPPSVSNFLQMQSCRDYKLNYFQSELSSLYEQYGGSRKEIYVETLPFFHLIGKSSLEYEVKERKFQRILDSERKLSRSRRLQHASSPTDHQTTVAQGPTYQYLRQNCAFSKESLDSLFQQFYSSLQVSPEHNTRPAMEQQQQQQPQIV